MIDRELSFLRIWVSDWGLWKDKEGVEQALWISIPVFQNALSRYQGEVESFVVDPGVLLATSFDVISIFDTSSMVRLRSSP